MKIQLLIYLQLFKQVLFSFLFQQHPVSLTQTTARRRNILTISRASGYLPRKNNTHTHIDLDIFKPTGMQLQLEIYVCPIAQVAAAATFNTPNKLFPRILDVRRMICLRHGYTKPIHREKGEGLPFQLFLFVPQTNTGFFRFKRFARQSRGSEFCSKRHYTAPVHSFRWHCDIFNSLHRVLGFPFIYWTLKAASLDINTCPCTDLPK